MTHALAFPATFLGTAAAAWVMLAALAGCAVLGVVQGRRLAAMRRTRARADDLNDLLLRHAAHGCAVYDVQGRLTASNDRYAELLDALPGTIRPGMTLGEMFALPRPGGTEVDQAEVDAFVRGRLAELAAGKGRQVSIASPGGRPLRIGEHPLRGGGWLAVVEDMGGARRVQSEIDFIRRFDPLTGLPNRSQLMRDLTESLTLAATDAAAGWPALLQVDVGQLKTLHDSFGDEVIETLLGELTARMRAQIEPIDILARTATDQFAVLLPRAIDPDQAAALAERLLGAINGRYEIGGHAFNAAVTIGIAAAPDHGAEAETLLHHASMARRMARAGSWGLFDPATQRDLARRMALEADLVQALHAGQFELMYQPQVDLRHSRVSGCEALLRWRHPVHGIISPLDFIPIAEASGLIVPLGAWVMRRACLDAAAWPAGIRVAVNLSAIQVRDPGLCAAVTQALAASGLAAARLELEVTETVLLEGDHTARGVLHQLKAMGVRISMDDFGTGHSSLSYLRDFPFDKIKIDKSFVQQMLRRDDCLAIVRAVTGLARTLGMAVTAEGTEELAQVERLRAEGCTEVQGYYYSRPVSLAQLWPLLDRNFSERPEPVLT